MEYMQLRTALGTDLAGPLEDAVLTALARTRNDARAQDALRGVMVALLGAVIWPKIDPDQIGVAEQQCSRELARALRDLARFTSKMSAKQVN